MAGLTKLLEIFIVSIIASTVILYFCLLKEIFTNSVNILFRSDVLQLVQLL